MTRKSVVFLACVLFLSMVSSATMAANQNPSLNWGYTDFLDAAIPPGPGGLIFNPKVSFYSANKLKDGDGHDVFGRNKLNLVAFAPQLIYVGNPGTLPCGLRWGAQAQWSIASLNVTSDPFPAGPGLTAGSGMMGDLVFGPFIQETIPLAKDWLLSWMLEFDTYAPVGSYDKDKSINVGANFWTFEPFLALTLQMPYGFEVSTRQHFTWNTKNKDYINPALTRNFNEHDLQAGNLWHFNFTASKSLDFISRTLRLGVVGYYGQQLTDDKLDSAHVSNSKEKVFAIGPGLSWMYFHKDERAPAAIFSLKSYWESGVENRFQGNRTVFRMIIPF
jgi:hypothetical protein